MTNWFRMTPNKSLDRGYLRTCVVYRCAKHYGASREWAIARLTERLRDGKRHYTPAMANRMAEIWNLAGAA